MFRGVISCKFFGIYVELGFSLLFPGSEIGQEKEWGKVERRLYIYIYVCVGLMREKMEGSIYFIYVYTYIYTSHL